MKNDARLFVISAPSGCGKGTILSRVFADIDVYYSVSCTTREPREGEEDGVHYHFLTDEQFKAMIEEDGFLEYAEFVKHSYGTPKQPVLDSLAAGRDVVLEIETQGAFQIKEKMPEAVLIFILAPSVREIRRRLYKRATEEAEVIENRVAKASEEIAKALRYDYVVMNDELEQAVADFETVYRAAKSGDGSADSFKTDREEIINMINEVLENA
ncbi:MAG: guanylate kinase [Ruminococcus sp.]|nr:guanylate kinase [Ruminococcus sp.]